MSQNDPSRLHTGELEIGYTEAVERHANRHVVAPKPVSQRKLDFENARPRWIREMAAEAMGVFFFVYPGIASCASFFLNPGDPGFGSVFQIGWAFAIGIAFAIITCGSTSGGHFNAAVTISCAVWLGGIVIWACLDPMNPFVSASAVPWVIGLGYATMIWGFADVTIELNSSRDLGARIVAAIFFGGDAFSLYSLIPVLTSIPAMLFGTALYEMIQRDSFAVIAKGHNVHEKGEEGIMQHLSKNGALAGSTSASGTSIDSEVWDNGRKNDSAV